MKDLVLVRHAKSSWKNVVQDIDRPLKKSGINTALLMADILKNSIPFRPDVWYTSNAKRALHTATIFAEKYNRIKDLKIVSEFYTFSEAKLLCEIVKKLDNKNNSAIIFCHNDAATNLVNKIGNEQTERIYTTGIAWIRFKTDQWKDIEKGGETKFILRPKKVLQ